MAAQNKQQERVSRRAKLFSKLDIAKDERLTREPIETGRISHFFSTFKKNYSDLMIANLLFMVFALPAIIIIFWLTPNMITELNHALDFNGDMGIGLGGRFDIIQGYINLYDSYQYMLLMLIPCFSVIGLGMAGLYYCARNFLWGAKVKVRVHFFRGIKKRWAEFLLAFTFMGGVICMLGSSILLYLKADLTGSVTAGHWVFMIFSALFTLLVAMYLTINLPMEMSFRYGFGSMIKNSTILLIASFFIVLVLLIVLALPTLFMLNSFLKMIFYIAVAMIGFSTYVMASTALGHKLFDSTILTIYEYEQRAREKEEMKERQRQNSINKRTKKKKKK